MRDFETVLNERRSAVKCIPGVELPDKELDDIFNLVKSAPSAFNLQHTHYIVVKNPDVKERVYKAAHRQYKIKLASAVILVLGHLQLNITAAILSVRSPAEDDCFNNIS